MTTKVKIIGFVLVAFVLSSFFFLSTQKFRFKNGAYKTYVVDSNTHSLGVTDYFFGHKGYHHIYDVDSVEHENCYEVADKFSWKIDRETNQLVFTNTEVWLKDSCGAFFHREAPFEQYFQILSEHHDSLVTKHTKDIENGNTHFYDKYDELYIWVYDSKLTQDQKKLIK